MHSTLSLTSTCTPPLQDAHVTYALALACVGQPARALKYLGDLSSSDGNGVLGDDASAVVFKV